MRSKPPAGWVPPRIPPPPPRFLQQRNADPRSRPPLPSTTSLGRLPRPASGRTFENGGTPAAHFTPPTVADVMKLLHPSPKKRGATEAGPSTTTRRRHQHKASTAPPIPERRRGETETTAGLLAKRFAATAMRRRASAALRFALNYCYSLLAGRARVIAALIINAALIVALGALWTTRGGSSFKFDGGAVAAAGRAISTAAVPLHTANTALTKKLLRSTHHRHKKHHITHHSSAAPSPRCDLATLRAHTLNASDLFSQHDLMWAKMLRSVETFEPPLMRHIFNATFEMAPPLPRLWRNSTTRSTYDSALASLLFSGSPIGVKLAGDLYAQELWAPEEINLGASPAAHCATLPHGAGPACALDLRRGLSYLPPQVLLARWRLHPATRCARKLFTRGVRAKAKGGRARFNERALVCSPRNHAQLALLRRVECVSSANARCHHDAVVNTPLRGNERHSALVHSGSATIRAGVLAWADAARAVTGGARLWSDAWITASIAKDVDTLGTCALRRVDPPAVKMLCTGTAHRHRRKQQHYHRAQQGDAAGKALTIGMHVDVRCATRACRELDPYLEQARIMAMLYDSSTIVLATSSHDVLDRILLEHPSTAAFQWCWADLDRESIADGAHHGHSTFTTLVDLHLFEQRADAFIGTAGSSVSRAYYEVIYGARGRGVLAPAVWLDTPFDAVDLHDLADRDSGVMHVNPLLNIKRNWTASPAAHAKSEHDRAAARASALETKLAQWLTASGTSLGGSGNASSAPSYAIRFDMAVAAIVSGRAKDAYSAHRTFNVSFIALQRSVSAALRKQGLDRT